ncbi:hypothetical protein EXS72_01200 [Candidatus Pacearchaeota archaeon]|nr:hypothetical protein [Candidatus Pacearchaeota archaeon]
MAYIFLTNQSEEGFWKSKAIAINCIPIWAIPKILEKKLISNELKRRGIVNSPPKLDSTKNVILAQFLPLLIIRTKKPKNTKVKRVTNIKNPGPNP